MMLIMLITGSSNTIIYKVQDGTYSPAPNSGYPIAVPFNQPFWQCAVMFVGELLCLGVYAIKTYMNKDKVAKEGAVGLMARKNADGKVIKTNINPLLLAIPAACDTIGSTLMNIALTMVPASIYQMMRGIVVIITAGMARIFLSKKQYPHHITSLLVLFLGIFLVGLSSILNPEDGSSDGNNTGLGIMMVIIAQFLVGT